MNGEYDYVARIVAPTLAAYEALTEAFLADPGFGIARIHTTFVLKTLKSFDGYPVARQREVSVERAETTDTAARPVQDIRPPSTADRS